MARDARAGVISAGTGAAGLGLAIGPARGRVPVRPIEKAAGPFRRARGKGSSPASPGGDVRHVQAAFARTPDAWACVGVRPVP